MNLFFHALSRFLSPNTLPPHGNYLLACHSIVNNKQQRERNSNLTVDALLFRSM